MANNLNVVASAVVGILMVPIVLVRLGPELYGLWAIALSVSGLFAVLELGLGRALVRDVAGTQLKKNSRETAEFAIVAGNRTNSPR